MRVQPLSTLWLPWKTQQIHGTNYFTNTGKNETFPLNQNLTCDLCRYLCDMQSTACWRNNKHVFDEVVGTESYLEQTT